MIGIQNMKGLGKQLVLKWVAPGNINFKKNYHEICLHWFGWRGGDDLQKKLQMGMFKVEAVVDFGTW